MEATITLTQGKVAIVDAADFEWLNQWKWYAKRTPSMKSFYAGRTLAKVDGHQGKNILMHRVILGLKTGDPRQGDHVNHNTLDNRDENLRIATSSQNLMNRGLFSSNTSGFKGVSRNTKGWRAKIQVDGKALYLGTRDTPRQAFELYCAAAEKFHGEFARVA